MIGKVLRNALPAFLFFILGTALALCLVPFELDQMHWEVPGMPDSYPIEQKLRPILLLLLCYLPFISALIYIFMGTMSRYISRCFITYFSLCTSILLLIYLLADFTSNIHHFNDYEYNPIGQTLIFYGTQLPMFLYQILPYTLMMGTLWCLSKLSGSSELVGMMQSGRSILRICRPIFLFSSVIALGYGICGFHWAPNGALYREIMLKQSKTFNSTPAPIIYRSDTSSRIWRIEKPCNMLTLGAPLQHLVIEQFDKNKKGKLLYQLHAEEAKWNKKDSSWTFTKVSKREILDPSIDFSPETFTQKEDQVMDSLTLPYTEKPYQIICPQTNKSNDSIGTSALYEFIASGAGSVNDRLQKRTEWHLRIARIFTCLILVLLAVPNAITFQRRTAMKGIGFALLLAVMLLFFYRVFPTLGESGILPAWLSVWLTNILYTLIAIWIFNKKLAHRTLFEYLKSK